MAERRKLKLVDRSLQVKTTTKIIGITIIAFIILIVIFKVLSSRIDKDITTALANLNSSIQTQQTEISKLKSQSAKIKDKELANEAGIIIGKYEENSSKTYRCCKSNLKLIILKSTESELNSPDELGSTFLRIPC